jgi:hypothetical protein
MLQASIICSACGSASSASIGTAVALFVMPLSPP